MSDKQQFNVYLTPGTVRRMKHYAVDAQLSLSDLVERVFTAYLAQPPVDASVERPPGDDGVTLQPILHVGNMGAALDFYSILGAVVLNGSRDGDWALLRFGGAELGLLAHPPNPEQGEGGVELCFAYAGALEGLEARLREAGVTVVRPTGDEGFGYQLQIADADGTLVKINQLDPDLYR